MNDLQILYKEAIRSKDPNFEKDAIERVKNWKIENSPENMKMIQSLKKMRYVDLSKTLFYSLEYPSDEQKIFIIKDYLKNHGFDENFQKVLISLGFFKDNKYVLIPLTLEIQEELKDLNVINDWIKDNLIERECMIFRNFKDNCCYSENTVCEKNKSCFKQYKDYKYVCANVWTKKCDNQSKREKDEIISEAKDCYEKRKKYTNNCCTGFDQEHCGSLSKMDNIIEKCKY